MSEVVVAAQKTLDPERLNGRPFDTGFESLLSGIEFMAAPGENPKFSVDFIITSGSKLITALQVLPEELKDDQEFVANLNIFAEQIQYKLLKEIDLKRPNQAADELCGILRELSSEFDRFGLSGHAQSFKELFRQSESGCLYEYRRVVNAGILDPKFGPQTWDVHMPAHDIESKWGTAREILRDMFQNSNCEELFRTTKDHLLKSAEIAASKPDEEAGFGWKKLQQSKKALKHSVATIEGLNW